MGGETASLGATSNAGTGKRQILFVDDEQSVLDGLRNALRVQRREWEMVFALGAAAALAEIDRRPFDVVVSDMRMPGTDGAALLTMVKEKQPCAVRIVLSGQTDLDNAMRTVLVAHQFLSKPCDAETLRSTVERACKLNTMLQSEGLKMVAGDVSMLPSSPGAYAAITRALADSKSSISDVARIVERDPGLCAKILQVANSAFFGIGRKVTSVTEASTYLGMMTLKNLALALGSFPQLQARDSSHRPDPSGTGRGDDLQPIDRGSGGRTARRTGGSCQREGRFSEAAENDVVAAVVVGRQGCGSAAGAYCRSACRPNGAPRSDDAARTRPLEPSS